MALILHILCGFSVGEIAAAFVSGRAAIEKRITRAKKVLAKIEAPVRCVGHQRLCRPPSGGPPRTLLALQRGLSRRFAGGGRARGTLPRGYAARGAAP